MSNKRLYVDVDIFNTEVLQSELEKERLARIDAEKKLEGNYSFLKINIT
jgi:hypothetical protein